MKFLKRPIALLFIAALVFTGFSFIEDFNSNPAPDEQAKVLNIGDKAPEISFKGPDDKVRNLSDLKGKIVLIDFWASWCRPCRMENPNVVKTYDKFKNAQFKEASGFEVFSVSLDQKKDSWVKAIKSDNLKWDNHVSELQGWKSKAAQAYNINAIPATFLVDQDGMIIATNLRGSSLSNTLEKLTK